MTISIYIPDLEHAAAPSWRALEEARLGDWLLRAAEGFTGRANSALAAGDPGMPMTEAIQMVSSWYDARYLPPMIAVAYPTGRPDRSELDEMLEGPRWTVRADAATVMTASAAGVASVADETRAPVAIDTKPDAGWLSQYHYRGQLLPSVALRVLTSAAWQAFGSVRVDGETIAIGRVASGGTGDDRKWAGLTAIEVDPRHRRKRLGTIMTAALAARAASQGAASLYLQVTDHNAAARTLYRQLGFTDHHGYRYRVAPS